MPKPSCASIFEYSSDCSGNDDVVPVFQQNILLGVLTFDHFFIVELQPFAVSQNYDLLGVGEILEAARSSQGVQDAGRYNEGKRTRAANLPGNVIFFTIHLVDSDRHFGI